MTVDERHVLVRKPVATFRGHAVMAANWIDRALASVAPGAARKRLMERQAFEKLARAYDGAAVGRRTDGWFTFKMVNGPLTPAPNACYEFHGWLTVLQKCYENKGRLMKYISPSMLAEEMTVVRLSPYDYDWNIQRRYVTGDYGKPDWLVMSGSTATETITGNLLDTDSDDDRSYD